MNKIKKFKRFKIVEQIIVVLLLAVLVPMVVSAFIINNINQHAVRNELQYSALTISESIASNIQTFFKSGHEEIDEILLAIKYIKNDYSKEVYLKDVLLHSDIFSSLDLVPLSDELKNADESIFYNEKEKSIEILKKVNDRIALEAKINNNVFEDNVFNIFKKDDRQIYILNSRNKLIAAHNYNKTDFDRVTYALPSVLLPEKSTIFGKVKNQPIAYFKSLKPEVTIIVNTTHQITKTTINTARFKIISALLVSTLFIIFVVGLYTYYLYINIRQLFKGIMALSMGNYKRKIRLLTSVFTPYEIVFLGMEFNKMVDEINNT